MWECVFRSLVSSPLGVYQSFRQGSRTLPWADLSGRRERACHGGGNAFPAWFGGFSALLRQGPVGTPETECVLTRKGRLWGQEGH